MKAVIRGTVRKRTSVSLTSATLLPGDDVEELADLLVGVVGDDEIVQCRDGAPVVAHLLGRELLGVVRSEEHTSELQSLMRISYAVFCLKKKTREDKSII